MNPRVKFKVGDKVEIIWANNKQLIGFQFIIERDPTWDTLLYEQFGIVEDWYYDLDYVAQSKVAERFLKLVNRGKKTNTSLKTTIKDAITV